MSKINWDYLRTYDNPEDYVSELSNAFNQIGNDSETIDQFYRIIMKHFEDTVPEDIGIATLNSLKRFISYKIKRDVFVQNKYAAALPYNQKNLTDDLLEVLYILVTRAPEAFTQEVADGFSRMIVRRPRKALHIISIYATYFKGLENAWPLLDDLIQGQRRFSVDECAKEYVLLLAYLVTEHRGFRRGRAKACFDCVAQNLESENEDVINATYSALASIVSVEQNIIVPFREIRAHLRFPQFESKILDFLLVCPLNFDGMDNPKFLQALLKIAARGEDEAQIERLRNENGVEYTKEESLDVSNRAALVLMRLAEDRKVRETLINTPKWLKADLPTTIHTLRLFLVIFKDMQCRAVLGRKPEFIDFLSNLNEVGDESIHSLICTIIRRINLNAALVKEMSKNEFIAAFLGNADEIGTDNSHYSAILFTDTLCKICFTKEFIPMCETVSNFIQEGGDNLSPAIKLATDLCKHQRCVEKFQKLRLAPYLERRISKMKNRGHIRALIKLIKGEEDMP
ncbi:hypothetical protein TVAG_365950 [Trichomonas vaginalis G3]|uniref:Uncharacterized protein n=1 Tax=Trichomonas vaginalis (strain ATCC PRA-98 / G3) TaxID=412133 RepID=A2DHN9_TRIV3|nr:armadillo (ARM) repeat-containing protein family [Trichomonas vaginalis G3]EAY20087.1 hypothetical protein TVAG_365950 [Trichomonas vaginalis G3]KAI5528040.1 armadillo (ARM) repeat-containing protein family [Trichomonas vaginalis G3]|eukprot:XP_001581073.1 hypothetical protein [Trichomonas vaginalis G3]